MRLYYVDRLSIAAVAKRLQVSTWVIWRELHEVGFPVRRGVGPVPLADRREPPQMRSTRMAEVLAAFGGGMAALFAAWRMMAHYEKRTADRIDAFDSRFDAFDKANREEHAALLDAIKAVEVRLGERIAAVEGKLDVLIADRRG